MTVDLSRIPPRGRVGGAKPFARNLARVRVVLLG
jgi:hypothetical protein